MDVKSSSGLDVRRADARDVDVLVQLMQAFYAEAHYPLDHAWAASSFRTLLETPALGSVWLACWGITPIGHAVLTVRYCMEFGGLSGYIDDLYVKPEFRRRGAGHALLSALFADCRVAGCKSAQVEVGDTNTAARALYARFGLKAASDGRVLLSGELPATGA